MIIPIVPTVVQAVARCGVLGWLRWYWRPGLMEVYKVCACMCVFMCCSVASMTVKLKNHCQSRSKGVQRDWPVYNCKPRYVK